MTTKNTTRAHELMKQVTYRREMEGSYHVVIDGTILGQVYKCWTRGCGWGWVSTQYPASGERTRKGATLRLIKAHY